MEPGSYRRRLVWGIGGSRGGRPLPGGDRYGHGRFRAGTCLPVRSSGTEANLWTGKRSRRDPAITFAGPRRADHAHGCRCGCAPAGYDPDDAYSANVPVGDYLRAIGQDVSQLRIGVPRAFFFDDLDAEVSEAIKHGLAVLQTLTAQVRDISLQVPTDRTLQSAESYAYHREWVQKSPQLYQPETLRRIRAGEKVSAGDVLARRREMEQERSQIANTFADCDVVVMPTMPIPPPVIADLKRNPENLRPTELKLLRNTRPINVWGLPAISVPCGFTAAGLPVGMQIVGRHWEEETILALAHAYEQATAWHKRRPGN